MRSLKVLGVVIVLVLVGIAVAPGATAATFDKAVSVTFNQPVQLPDGRMLEAGTYTFTVMPHQGSRNVIQIFNKDRTAVQATILAIPKYRATRSDVGEIRLEEQPIGAPMALQAWFYPGERYGHEFVWGK